MKKPILHAFVAVVYIVFIVSLVNFSNTFIPKETLLIPMVMLGLFVLSAAVMGFLFLSEPLRLYLDGQKHEAYVFFGKTVAALTGFLIIGGIILFLI